MNKKIEKIEKKIRKLENKLRNQKYKLDMAIEKRDENVKKIYFYVNGYVCKTDLMTKKEAKKKYGSVFNTENEAKNFRMAGIMAG